MRRHQRLVLAMAVTAAIAFQVAYAVTKARGTAAAQTNSAQVEQIGATEWAAFVADIRTSNGDQEVFSRYYQNSNGSNRTEAFSPGRKERVVTIHNRERRMSYFEGPTGEWAMFPLETQRALQPRRLRVDTTGLSSMPEQRLGYTVYEHMTDGRRSLLAPDLNLFVMLTDWGNEREEVLSITMQEPAAELFYPPANVNVRQATSVKDMLRISRTGR